MSARIPAPGPSFLRERTIRVHDHAIQLGMARPTDGEGGWWVAVCWAADTDGLVSYRDVAPLGGPPPEPPAMRLGPGLAGALSGLILEDDGRLQFRVAAAIPAADPGRPWDAPLAVLVGIRPEPMRAATMRPNEFAETVLAAFARAVEGIGRP